MWVLLERFSTWHAGYEGPRDCVLRHYLNNLVFLKRFLESSCLNEPIREKDSLRGSIRMRESATVVSTSPESIKECSPF